MTKYQIWMAGYLVSGMEGIPAKAKLIGEAEGPTFGQACAKLLVNHHDFNADKLEFWGCKLFDNETDARRSFG